MEEGLAYCGWSHHWKGDPGLCKKAGQASHKTQGSHQNSSMTSASVMAPPFFAVNSCPGFAWWWAICLINAFFYKLLLAIFFLNRSNRKQTEIKVCARFMGYGCDRHDHILGWMVEWLWNVWQAQTLRSQSLMTCCCERLTDRNAERDADDGSGSFRGKKDHKCHLCYILYYMTFWSAGSENQL